MARHVIIHPGQHKTGSTSIQEYLIWNRAFLRERGIEICCDWSADLTQPSIAVESINAKSIANAIIRPSLQTPVRIGGTRPPLPPHVKQDGLDRINAHLRGLPVDTALISAESLSFLREPREMQRLARLCRGMSWSAVMFLREPSSWLASWEIQVAHSGWPKQPGAAHGVGVLDLSENSWLVDHDAIRATWGVRCTFLSYEAAMAQHGSVIPAFLEAIGLDPRDCPGWDGFFSNSSAIKQTLAAGIK